MFYIQVQREWVLFQAVNNIEHSKATIVSYHTCRVGVVPRVRAMGPNRTTPQGTPPLICIVWYNTYSALQSFWEHQAWWSHAYIIHVYRNCSAAVHIRLYIKTEKKKRTRTHMISHRINISYILVPRFESPYLTSRFTAFHGLLGLSKKKKSFGITIWPVVSRFSRSEYHTAAVQYLTVVCCSTYALFFLGAIEFWCTLSYLVWDTLTHWVLPQ